jgi:hypothetical protein
MHDMGAGDHLDVHLDASHHPKTGLERRANAILFLSEEWLPGWGGAFHLYGGGVTDKVVPHFGDLLVFETTDDSLHGVPDTLRCPEGRAPQEPGGLLVLPAPLGRVPAPAGEVRGPAGRPGRAVEGRPARGAVPAMTLPFVSWF